MRGKSERGAPEPEEVPTVCRFLVDGQRRWVAATCYTLGAGLCLGRAGGTFRLVKLISVSELGPEDPLPWPLGLEPDRGKARTGLILTGKKARVPKYMVKARACMENDEPATYTPPPAETWIGL